MENRYSRQIALPEIGDEGQRKIQQAKVLVVGVGGLGSPISLYLSGAGVGTIGLMDADEVSLTNLQRQVLYTEKEIGLNKALCAARRLAALNSEIKLIPYPFRLTPENAREIISLYDMVVDGCDNFETRYLISDTCHALHKPYVYGAIQHYEGQVAVLCQDEAARTYRDLFPEENERNETPKMKGNEETESDEGIDCDEKIEIKGNNVEGNNIEGNTVEGNTIEGKVEASNAVLATTPAVVGSVEANEVLKLITGSGQALVNKLWSIDLLSMQSFIIDL